MQVLTSNEDLLPPKMRHHHGKGPTSVLNSSLKRLFRPVLSACTQSPICLRQLVLSFQVDWVFGELRYSTKLVFRDLFIGGVAVNDTKWADTQRIIEGNLLQEWKGAGVHSSYGKNIL